MDPRRQAVHQAEKGKIMCIIFFSLMTIFLCGGRLTVYFNAHREIIKFFVGNDKMVTYMIKHYEQVDVLVLMAATAHILMVLEPISDLWVDRHEQMKKFPSVHLLTILTYLFSAAYGLPMVSKDHLPLLTSACIRALLDFLIIVIHCLKKVTRDSISILMGVSLSTIVVIKFIKGLITSNQEVNEGLFGTISVALTAWMAVASGYELRDKISMGEKIFGPMSYIAPICLTVSSICWLIYAICVTDTYTMGACISLIVGGLVQILFLYERETIASYRHR